jgi:hypothetical protein
MKYKKNHRWTGHFARAAPRQESSACSRVGVRHVPLIRCQGGMDVSNLRMCVRQQFAQDRLQQNPAREELTWEGKRAGHGITIVKSAGSPPSAQACVVPCAARMVMHARTLYFEVDGAAVVAASLILTTSKGVTMQTARDACCSASRGGAWYSVSSAHPGAGSDRKRVGSSGARI